MAVGQLQDRLSHLAAQGRDAATGAVRACAGAVEHMTGQLPDPETAVRAYFSVAEETIRVQREVALGVVQFVRGGAER